MADIKLVKQDNVLDGVVGAQGELFDYSKLDQETQILLRVRAGEIQGLAKRMASDTVQIGGKLAEVKDRLGGNGRFVEWLHSELRWSERTAYNFIAVHQKFAGEDMALENVAASALYLLAAPSTPAEAVAAAKQIANDGEQVTHTVAKEIVRQAKSRRAAQQPALVDEPEEPESEEPETLFGDQEPEETPKEASTGFDGASFTTVRSAAEIERMAKLQWTFQGQDDDVVQICYVEDRNGRQQPFFVTEYDQVDDAVEAWPLVALADYQGKPIGYGEFLDTEREIDDLAGVKLNCGSKTKPAWYVVVKPKMVFTAEPAKESAPKSQPTTEQVKSESEAEELWKKTKLEVGFTFMPADGNPAGRMVVGSIAAEGFNTLFFNVRGWEAAGLAKLEVELARFKREMLERRQKPAPKTSATPAKTPSKPAPKPPAKKAAAKAAAKSAKKGGSKK